jgi:hypothetical protein
VKTLLATLLSSLANATLAASPMAVRVLDWMETRRPSRSSIRR